MPANLRFVLLLLCATALAAAASIFVSLRQDDDRVRTTAEELTGGQVAAGKEAFARFGCGSCHHVGGSTGIAGKVGPALAGIAVRAELAGHLSNRPDHMVLWIRHPQQVAPGNGMPDQSISERDAQDIAAYLYTLQTAW